MQAAKVIESVSNLQVKHLVKLRNDKAYRKEKNSVMVLGSKVYEELAKSDAPIRGIYYTNAYKPLLQHVKKRDVQLFQVTDEIINKVSGVKGDAEGIVTEVELPTPLDHHILSQPIQDSPPLLLILDRIQDPGNLGTLIRTATALNWTGVYITPSSVDPFNDKAIRAARGATFRIPLIYDVSVTDVKKQFEKAKQHWRILIADAKGKDINAVINERQTRRNKGIALILGSEARGVSGDFWKEPSETVGIPMSGNQESLNVAVAGGILMEKLAKHKT